MKNGAIFGIVVAVSDLVEWRGPKYLPWEGQGITANISRIGAYVLGGMLLFYLAASIRRAFTKEP